MLASSFVALAAFLGSVAAHGHINSINVDGKPYQGYNPQQGTTEPSISRPVKNKDNGFVSLPWGADLVCGVANNGETAPLTAAVAAGGTIDITWDTWPESHVGPVTDYLADCGGDCSTFETTTSTKWFPIQKYAMADGKWLVNGPTGINAGTKFTHHLVVPAGVPNGNYVLRHEIVGLHGAPSEVQAYPQCFQIEVTGGAASAPAGLETCTFPACYDGAEGFANNIYNPAPTTFPIPGPEVAFGSSGGSAPAPAAPKPSSSSVQAPTPSASSTPATPAEPIEEEPVEESPATPETPVEDADPVEEEPVEEETPVEEPVEQEPVEEPATTAAPAPAQSSAPAPSKPETPSAPSTPGSFADYNTCMKAMNECKNKINSKQGGGERDFSTCETIGAQCTSLRKRHMKKAFRNVH